MGVIPALNLRFDIVKMELRSGFYNQCRGHMLNLAKVSAYQGMIAEKVDHTWNSARMDINRFDCLTLKD
jgi:hypothetical protein